MGRSSSQRSAGPYQYQPLKKNEFRLLQLLPLPKSSEAPLRCRLKHVYLLERTKVIKPHDIRRKRNVKYEAISYYWGDPTRSSVVEVDGRTFHLPINSEKALRRMAFPDRIRMVFLDAVCTNQDDPAERSTQVRLMGDIYRKSQCTLVTSEKALIARLGRWLIYDSFTWS